MIEQFEHIDNGLKHTQKCKVVFHALFYTHTDISLEFQLINRILVVQLGIMYM